MCKSLVSPGSWRRFEEASPSLKHVEEILGPGVSQNSPYGLERLARKPGQCLEI